MPPRQSPELYQLERVAKTLSAPSKTFEDIKRGNTSWWMPFLIVLLTGGFLFFAVTKEVTWKTVYENQQNAMPEFAKRMQAQMPPEQKAAADRRGPITQEITWALSPIGLLLMNMIAALILWPTDQFRIRGQGDIWQSACRNDVRHACFMAYKLILAGVSLFAGVAPEAFNLQNIAGTNVAYYLSKQEHSRCLVWLLMYLDTAGDMESVHHSDFGFAVVAGVKRSSGYIAVFGWWVLLLLIGVGFAAAFGMILGPAQKPIGAHRPMRAGCS